MVKFAFFVAYNLQRSVLSPWAAVNGADGTPVPFFVLHWVPYLSEGVVVATPAAQQSQRKIRNTEGPGQLPPVQSVRK